MGGDEQGSGKSKHGPRKWMNEEKGMLEECCISPVTAEEPENEVMVVNNEEMLAPR